MGVVRLASTVGAEVLRLGLILIVRNSVVPIFAEASNEQLFKFVRGFSECRFGTMVYTVGVIWGGPATQNPTYFPNLLYDSIPDYRCGWLSKLGSPFGYPKKIGAAL